MSSKMKAITTVETECAVEQKLPEKSFAKTNTRASLRRSSKLRVSATIGPAALMTLGLFTVMASLIATDFQPVEAKEARTIESIVPEEIDELETGPRPEFELIEIVAAPPPPILIGEAPTDFTLGPIQKPEISPVAIPDTDATPLRPPVVSYPSIAITDGITGECQVTFDVDRQGRPFNIVPNCSDNVFSRAAKKAISRVEFAPKIQLGKAIERKNVVYPIVFSLTE